ncbi:MAG: hypothetical protein IH861_13515 [Chloroflexi bacterium]|nr:hypothetical protein [Chloroflexota bacterium]
MTVCRTIIFVIIVTVSLAACVQYAAPEEPESEAPTHDRAVENADSTIPGPTTRALPSLRNISAVEASQEELEPWSRETRVQPTLRRSATPEPTGGANDTAARIAPAPFRWTTHGDPFGFSLERPSTWSVDVKRDSGSIAVMGPGHETVVIWPLFITGSLNPGSFGQTFRRLLAGMTPGTKWGPPESAAKGALRSSGESVGTRSEAFMTWKESDEGTAINVYIMRAPLDLFEDSQDVFARIAESFRPSGPPSAIDTAVSRYLRWEDPAESAFSVDVPAGWQIEGGVRRPSLALAQARVEATSPDEEIYLYLGDGFSFYIEPNAVLASSGIGTGGVYRDNAGVEWPVRYYAPGADFLTQFLFPTYPSRVEIVSSTALPDVNRALNATGLGSFHASLVEYVYDREGEARRGGALIVTTVLSHPIGRAWKVWRLYAAEAPPVRFGDALSELEHLAGSFQMNEAWLRSQTDLTGAQSQIIADMSPKISGIISDKFGYQQQAYDGILDRGSDARRVVERTTDPRTGETIEVWAGSSYYWLDQNGAILGTDAHARPRVDFRELLLQ